jgi:hypothetical protein
MSSHKQSNHVISVAVEKIHDLGRRAFQSQEDTRDDCHIGTTRGTTISSDVEQEYHAEKRRSDTTSIGSIKEFKPGTAPQNLSNVSHMMAPAASRAAFRGKKLSSSGITRGDVISPRARASAAAVAAAAAAVEREKITVSGSIAISKNLEQCTERPFQRDRWAERWGGMTQVKIDKQCEGARSEYQETLAVKSTNSTNCCGETETLQESHGGRKLLRKSVTLYTSGEHSNDIFGERNAHASGCPPTLSAVRSPDAREVPTIVSKKYEEKVAKQHLSRTSGKSGRKKAKGHSKERGTSHKFGALNESGTESRENILVGQLKKRLGETAETFSVDAGKSRQSSLSFTSASSSSSHKPRGVVATRKHATKPNSSAETLAVYRNVDGTPPDKVQSPKDGVVGPRARGNAASREAGRKPIPENACARKQGHTTIENASGTWRKEKQKLISRTSGNMRDKQRERRQLRERIQRAEELSIAAQIAVSCAHADPENVAKAEEADAALALAASAAISPRDRHILKGRRKGRGCFRSRGKLQRQRGRTMDDMENKKEVAQDNSVPYPLCAGTVVPASGRIGDVLDGTDTIMAIRPKHAVRYPTATTTDLLSKLMGKIRHRTTSYIPKGGPHLAPIPPSPLSSGGVSQSRSVSFSQAESPEYLENNRRRTPPPYVNEILDEIERERHRCASSPVRSESPPLIRARQAKTHSVDLDEQYGTRVSKCEELMVFARREREERQRRRQRYHDAMSAATKSTEMDCEGVP